MKHLFVIVGCCMVLSAFSGCQNGSAAERGVRVVIEGEGEFPEFFAGKWKSNKDAWEIVFGPDGRILSAVVGLGYVKIIPGRTKTVDMREGGKGIYKPGLWTVHYSPLDRELMVEITIEHVHLEMGSQVLEGKSKDVFVGEVLEDGKIWRTEHYAYPEYIAYTPEPKPLSSGEDEAFAGVVTFEKVEE